MSVLRRKRSRPQADVEHHIRHELAAMQIVMANPNVATFFARAGGGRGAGNSGFISIRTVPKSDRKDSLDDIVAELRPNV